MPPLKYCLPILLFPKIKSKDQIKHIDEHEILSSWFLQEIYYRKDTLTQDNFMAYTFKRNNFQAKNKQIKIQQLYTQYIHDPIKVELQVEKTLLYLNLQ